MGAHGADKLLKDVQTYHDMHHEIVTQKKHQMTPPRIRGKYGERPCKNPQCSECPKPRHISVSFSNSRQEATILRGSRQTNEQQLEERSSLPTPSAANSWSKYTDKQQIKEQILSPPAAASSPPRQIAALTQPRVVAAPSKLFDNNKPANIFISPHIPRIRKWDLIVNGMLEKPPVDNVDYTHMIPGGLNRLLKRQGEQNERAMQNILGQAGRKVRQEEKEKLLARQEEQKNRQAFRLLPGQENKQKLRRPHVLVPVPMGLPSMSAEWNEKDSDEWCRKHVPNWHSGRKIIDANGQHLATKSSNDDDKMISYANEEGKQLYRVRDVRSRTRPTPGRTLTSQPASAATQRQQQRPHPHQLKAWTSKSCSHS
jgi:hypothetical protein